jgi:dephospho-CoA kinase
MYKVGITGGIGSGKSLVADMLLKRGVALYSSDSRAKELMASDPELRQQLVERFGSEVFCAEGLNRAYLAERVFASDEELKALNAIVHPRVMADFEQWAEKQSGDYVVLESAILYESGFDALVDKVVAVLAPLPLRVERAMQRDGASREQIEARIKAQMSDDELMARADFAIVNFQLEDVEKDVVELNHRFKMMANE